MFGIFPVDLGMPLLFTDFQQSTSDPLPVGKSVNIGAIHRYTGKNPT